MNSIWQCIESIIDFLTDHNIDTVSDKENAFINKSIEKAAEKFKIAFLYYTSTLLDLKTYDFTTFIREIYYDPQFTLLIKVIVILLVLGFSCYISFVNTRDMKFKSFRCILTLVIYFFISGKYTSKLSDVCECIYDIPGLKNMPLFLEYARRVDFPLLLIALVLSIFLSLIYKMVRILVVVLGTLKLKNYLFNDNSDFECSVLFLLMNLVVFFLFNKIISIIEAQIVAIVLSAVGTLSIVSHLIIYDQLRNNTLALVQSLVTGNYKGLLKNPAFLTWIVLFAFSLKLTCSSYSKSK